MNVREEELMNLLWDSGKPMTSVDFEQSVNANEWNHAAVFRIIKSLLAKGLIEECGTELRGKQWTRKFRPTLTREEYMAQFLVERGIDGKSLARVAMAVVRKSRKSAEENEELIEELENIIQKIRERGKDADK